MDSIRYSKKMQGQIIAFGGGGFSDEPNNPLVDDYKLTQSSANPKIYSIGSASGDAEGSIQNYYKCFEKKDCIPSHLVCRTHR